MKSILNPLFANTCGKIFHDRIELASHRGDSTLYRDEVTGAALSSNLLKKEILFACLPLVLPALSFFLKPEETGLKVLFIVLGVGTTILMFFKGQRKHTLCIHLKNGKTRHSRVHAENIMDARKFVREIEKMVHSNKTKGPENIAGTVNRIAAEI